MEWLSASVRELRSDMLKPFGFLLNGSSADMSKPLTPVETLGYLIDKTHVP